MALINNDSKFQIFDIIAKQKEPEKLPNYLNNDLSIKNVSSQYQKIDR